MLDIKFIREHPDLVKEGIRKKGEVDTIDEILELDTRLRAFGNEHGAGSSSDSNASSGSGTSSHR